MTATTAERAPRSIAQRILLATGFAGVLFIGAFVVLGALAPGYDPARETISALEFTPLSMAQRINFFGFGLLLCTFAVALRRELWPYRHATVIPAFQLLSGLGVIGDAIFIHFPGHLVCVLVAFLSTLIVLCGFALHFRRLDQWRGWSAYSVVTAVLMMVLLTAFGYANHAGGPAGLMEKSATGVRTLWSVLFAWKLLRGARIDLPFACPGSPETQRAHRCPAEPRPLGLNEGCSRIPLVRPKVKIQGIAGMHEKS